MKFVLRDFPLGLQPCLHLYDCLSEVRYSYCVLIRSALLYDSCDVLV